MTERDALTYSRFMRESAGDYLSCYLELDSTDHQTLGDAAQVVISSKGPVSDAIFRRQRSTVRETDTSILRLAEDYRLAKRTLAQAYVAGAQAKSKLDTLSQAVEHMESELAKLSRSFQQQQETQSVTAVSYTHLRAHET